MHGFREECKDFDRKPDKPAVKAKDISRILVRTQRNQRCQSKETRLSLKIIGKLAVLYNQISTDAHIRS